jgi:predicted HTH transcriptional regulator
VEQWIVNIASNNCDPPIRPIIRKVKLPDPHRVEQHLLLVHVRKSLYVHRTQAGRWYVRVGSTKRDLTHAELMRLSQQRGRTFVFDEMAVATAAREDIDDSLVQQIIGTPKAIDMVQLLINRRVLLEDDEDILRPSVAGVLCFSRDPAQHLHGSLIHAAVYGGMRRDSDDLVNPQDIRGPANVQIDEATQFVERFMLKPSRKGVGREDFPQYSLGVVQEAIVNAVAHRDYSISGSRIRLFLFSDRLELMSPGSLPNTVTIETMRDRQFTRNQLLVSFLSKMTSRRNHRHFIEERGEGVARIIDESREHSGREPEYVLQGEELKLTIWAKASPHQEGD